MSKEELKKNQQLKKEMEICKQELDKRIQKAENLLQETIIFDKNVQILYEKKKNSNLKQ